MGRESNILVCGNRIRGGAERTRFLFGNFDNNRLPLTAAWEDEEPTGNRFVVKIILDLEDIERIIAHLQKEMKKHKANE